MIFFIMAYSSAPEELAQLLWIWENCVSKDLIGNLNRATHDSVDEYGK